MTRSVTVTGTVHEAVGEIRNEARRYYRIIPEFLIDGRLGKLSSEHHEALESLNNNGEY